MIKFYLFYTIFIIYLIIFLYSIILFLIIIFIFDLKNWCNIKTDNNSFKKFTKAMNKFEIVDTTTFFITKIKKNKISENNRVLIDKYVKIQICGN